LRASQRDMNFTISQGRWMWMGLKYKGNMVALTFM
jgi:hypothetical protein